MALTEESRHRLYIRLDEQLGPQEATTLMELLPPVGWADVATKLDLEHLGVAMKHDIEKVRADLSAEINGLRGEMTAEINGLRGEMTAGFAELRGEMAELRADIQHDLRVLALTLMTTFVGLAGVVVAAATVIA